MDITSAVIGTLLLVISILPFIILSRNRKLKTKKTVEVLQRIATDQGATLHNIEICTNFIIGMDEEKNMLFFFKHTANQSIKKIIKLTDFQACKLIKETRTVGREKDTYEVIDRLALTFMPKPTDNSDSELEFYNSDNAVQVAGELQILEKWCKIATNHFKKIGLKTML